MVRALPKKSFETWMRDVDKWLLQAVGVTHEDLPDWPYQDAYEDGMWARTAAHFVQLQNTYRVRLVTKYGFSEAAFKERGNE
jgi:hypothetical protein